MKKMILLLALILSPMMIWAADIKAPFTLPSARVLPKGVRNLSFKTVLAEASEKYNNSSSQVSVADPFFKNITYKDMIMGKRDPVDKAGIISVMDTVGANQDDKFAQTIGQVNIKATAYVPVLAWGISKKATLAVAVPVVQYSTNVDTGVVYTDPTQYNKFLEELEKRGAGLKSSEFMNKMNAPIVSKLQEYNYEPLSNEQGSALGDIKVVAKQKVFENDLNLLAIQTELTLPTGRKGSINKVINVTGGDGQTDLGAGFIHDLSINEHLTLSSQAIYTIQFADKEAMRIPERQDSKLTPDIDNNTDRDLGDSVIAQTGLKLNYSGFNLGTGYSLQYKDQDAYEGTVYESEHYSWLSQDTRQRMQGVQFVAGYDTIEAYKKGQFKAPLSILFNYTVVVEGKNVVKDPVASVDFNLFF